MRYLALVYSSEEGWAQLPEADREAVYEDYRAFAADPRVADGAELQAAATATTVRVRGDETVVSDGPFAETKEQLGGYFVLDCDSFDEAVALAARIPGAAHGTIEVRPAYVEAAQESREDAA